MIADPAPVDPRAVIERQIAMLGELAEIGMEIAREARTCGPERDPALIFSRAARAVRQTLALQARLLKDLADLDEAARAARHTLASDRRRRARVVIEHAVETGCDDEDETERLTDLACERLRDADDADLAGLSVAEIVARICTDLDLPAEWCANALSSLPLWAWEGVVAPAIEPPYPDRPRDPIAGSVRGPPPRAGRKPN